MTKPTGWQAIARRIRVPMGFVCAAIFLALAHPTGRTLAGSVALVAPGLWLRAYASGYVRKNAELTVTGPYAYTRNPLYLGSMLITFGFAAAAWNLWLLLGLTGIFAAIYIPTIQLEEAFLRTQFAGFAAYAARVPRLLPRLSGASTAGERGSFSAALYRKHREYNSLMGSAAIYLALLLRLVSQHYTFDLGISRPPWWP